MDNLGNSLPVTDDNGRTYAEQQAAQKSSWTRPRKQGKSSRSQKQPQLNTNNWAGPRPTPSNSWSGQGSSTSEAPRYRSVFGNSPQSNTSIRNSEGERVARSALIWGILSTILVFTFAFSLVGFIFGFIGFRKAKKARTLGFKASGGYWLSLSSVIFGGLSVLVGIFGFFGTMLNNF